MDCNLNKQHIRHLFAFLALAAISIILYACSAAHTSATPAKQTFTFDYKTPTASKPNSAGVLVSLVRPRYALRFDYAQSDIFVNFRDAFENDLKELIIDKGFNIQNVFPSFDNLTYEDKKQTDVAIEIEIDPHFSTGQGGWKTYTPFQFSPSGNAEHEYGFIGSVSLIGKINITGKEPLSHEIIWVKSVSIPSVTNIDISTYYRYKQPLFDNNFYNDPNVYNALGAALQKQYASILSQMDSYLDPREFVDLMPQVKELKNKKVY